MRWLTFRSPLTDSFPKIPTRFSPLEKSVLPWQWMSCPTDRADPATMSPETDTVGTTWPLSIEKMSLGTEAP
eukprot:627137-Pleurochrysis_carterae.AAC.1